MILAGHSMGGIAITQAAENCPKHIGALVVNPTTTIPRDDGTIAFKPEHSREAYYGDCTDEDAAFAESRLVAQSAAPFGTPVETTPERWGRIPRYYIECERDRAITFRLQREMQKLSPCRQTFSIDTDHSPFLSVPKQLADILLRIGSA